MDEYWEAEQHMLVIHHTDASVGRCVLVSFGLSTIHLTFIIGYVNAQISSSCGCFSWSQRCRIAADEEIGPCDV